MKSNRSMQLLVDALRRPSSMASLDPVQWDLLMRQARASDTLGRMGEGWLACCSNQALPGRVAYHLEAARLLARRQQVELGYEVTKLATLLGREGIALLLLKGAAYSQAGLWAGRGRMVSDIDILVPRLRLADAESALMKGGWVSTTRDPYDQRYYRQWMHEIPALRHVQRGSVLDVHHSVVPPTAGYRLDAQRMLDAAQPLEGPSNVFVLSDTDMVLHSAVHLMHEGELEMGFRGLVDLDALVTEFSGRDDFFWDRLIARAIELDLQRPGFLALRYAQAFLGTEIPAAHIAQLRVLSGLRSFQLAALDALYERGLRPHHVTLNDRCSGTARFVLYMRSHLLRMPLHLLLPHLARKSLRRMKLVWKAENEVNDVPA